MTRHELRVWGNNSGSSYYPQNVPTPNPQNDLLFLKDESGVTTSNDPQNRGRVRLALEVRAGV